MKFYGVDMQGRYLLEEAASPTWVAADDRRMVRDSDTGTILIGTSSGWDELVTNATGGTGALDLIYHQLNGNATDFFRAIAYHGNANHMRTVERWFKLSSGLPVPGSNATAGIKVEANSAGSDADDATLYFNGSDWYVDNTIAAASIIATQDYVGTWVAANFVRNLAYGPGGELYDHQVNWLTAPHGATASNVFNRVVARDSSGFINVTYPTSNSHAATKLYVDDQVGAIEGINPTSWQTVASGTESNHQLSTTKVYAIFLTAISITNYDQSVYMGATTGTMNLIHRSKGLNNASEADSYFCIVPKGWYIRWSGFGTGYEMALS